MVDEAWYENDPWREAKCEGARLGSDNKASVNEAERGVASTPTVGTDAPVGPRRTVGGEKVPPSLGCPMPIDSDPLVVEGVHVKDVAVAARQWALRLAQNPRRVEEEVDGSGRKDCSELKRGWIS